MINELINAVEPFLNGWQEVSSAGQETLPQVPENTSLELGQSRLLEVDNRVVVPGNTHLRDIAGSAGIAHSMLDSAEAVHKKADVPVFEFRSCDRTPQSEAAGPSFMLGQGKRIKIK